MQSSREDEGFSPCGSAAAVHGCKISLTYAHKNKEKGDALLAYVCRISLVIRTTSLFGYLGVAFGALKL